MPVAEAAIKNSKIARSPIVIPDGVEIKITSDVITMKGKNGELSLQNNMLVNVDNNEAEKSVQVTPKNSSKEARAMSGTYAARLKNMVLGVTEGFQKTLKLVGVGYRAKLAGKKIELTIGYSHPVVHDVPSNLTVETPDQTTIVVKGNDKQAVGQLAADIRSYREPENYKGKGIRYIDEVIIIKETKK